MSLSYILCKLHPNNGERKNNKIAYCSKYNNIGLKIPTTASPQDAVKSENKKHDSERETQLPHGPLPAAC